MIGNRKDDRSFLLGLPERLPDVLLGEESIPRADVQTTRDPTSAVAGNLIVVVIRVVRLPSGRGTAPVAQPPILDIRLALSSSLGKQCLVGKIEGNVLFEKPMAFGTGHMESWAVGGGEPAPIDDSTADDLVEAVRRGPPMGRTAMGLSPKGVGMEMKVQSILARVGPLQGLAIMIEHVVKADVSPSWIDLVVNVVHAEPVINPTSVG